MESAFADLLLPGALSVVTFLIYSARLAWPLKVSVLGILAAIEAQYATPDRALYGMLCVLVRHTGFVFYQFFVHVPKGQKGSRFGGMVRSLRSFRSDPDEPVVKPALTVSPAEARQLRPRRPPPHRPTPHPEVPPAFDNDGPVEMEVEDDETTRAIEEALYAKMLDPKADPRKSRGPSITRYGQ